MKQQKKPGTWVQTRTVITTVINERLQYIKSLTTTQRGKKFIPNYTTEKKEAQDFEKITTARSVLKKIVPPQVRVFCIDTVDVEMPLLPVIGGADNNHLINFI